jgi:hypothetical protein
MDPTAIPLDPPSQAKGEDKRAPNFTPFGTKGVDAPSNALQSVPGNFTPFFGTKGVDAPSDALQSVPGNFTPFGTKGVDAQHREDGGDAPGPASSLPSETGSRQRDVLRIADIGFAAPTILLAEHGLELVRIADGAPIPGSYWGEPEAGVIASRVYARADTPVHSLLHEACHLLVADPARRAAIHTDASDSLEEEDATCYLQIMLADSLPGFGRARALADMDAWGYSFRLGSARAWFEHDAEDALAFLQARHLLPG